MSPEAARRPRPNAVLILLILLFALGITGEYIYQHRPEMEARSLLKEKGIYEWQYNSSMITAARNGDSELLTLLISAGVDVNAENSDSYTPLLCASAGGHSECARLIREAGGKK